MTYLLAIAAMGLCIAVVLQHLGVLSAFVSSYVRESSGWYALSTVSYVARAGIAVGMLTPIALLMGGTLTLLVRHLVRPRPAGISRSWSSGVGAMLPARD